MRRKAIALFYSLDASALCDLIKIYCLWRQKDANWKKAAG